jgi:hypothetical protein
MMEVPKADPASMPPEQLAPPLAPEFLEDAAEPGGGTGDANLDQSM